MLQEEEMTSIAEHNAQTILVVEDDADNRALYTEAFALLTPYHVQVVRDGSQALTFVRHIKPSLFLLDNRLPGLNGIDLYDQLHSTPGLERIPAIIISSVSSQEVTDQIESRKLILIEKPFDLDDVLSTVATVLSWQREHT
jgi:CheY-like chemotaxis protein